MPKRGLPDAETAHHEIERRAREVVDAETDRILGCAVLGIEGGELMAMAQIAMLSGLPNTALRDGIIAHPSLAEPFNNLFGMLEG
ncbi:MAG TPA: hypothetical protein VJY65_03305 [Chloroflexota bacterium]|nr:hypothetical protein [Chloroflexota bacterium]